MTLTGRLLTLGLADLKGNVGISFDAGAWIGSAFNVAIMFIGPFTVFLAALLGARRVLLVVRNHIHAGLRLSSLRPQLLSLDRPAGGRGAYVRHFLPADADLHPAQHSTALHGSDDRSVCNLHRGIFEFCFLLCMVFFEINSREMDVLVPSRDRSNRDDMCLLWNPAPPETIRIA